MFRRSEGLFLSPPDADKMEEDFLEACEGRELDLVGCFTSWKAPNADLGQIVVTDAEAILGIGDQGSGGIGISSAKAVIYTLAAGVEYVDTHCGIGGND